MTAADLGDWDVTLSLIDTAANTATYTFTVTVENEPPAYDDPAVTYSSFSMGMNSTKVVSIFPNYDPEGT